jgi:hypothetical protein
MVTHANCVETPLQQKRKERKKEKEGRKTINKIVNYSNYASHL